MGDLTDEIAKDHGPHADIAFFASELSIRLIGDLFPSGTECLSDRLLPLFSRQWP